jgi:Concanavalin A-like lectin/glucanases superfamily
MKKTLCCSIAMLLLLLSCVKKPGNENRDNPFDPQSDNWHPPTVTAMADTTVAIYDSVPLHATGTDSVGTVVKFLWARDAKTYKDTSDSVFWIRFTHVGNETLLVKAVNNQGLPSVNQDTVIVHVHLYAPVITVSPISPVVSIGDTVALHAQARDTNGSIKAIYWATDGKNFSSTPGDSILKISYSSQGTMTVLVKAIDDDTIATIDTTRIFVKADAPLIYAPADSALLSSNSTTLKWLPGYFNSSFKVLLDTVNPPKALGLAATRDSSYTATNLVLGKRYYWSVIGYNAQDSAAPGQMWTFTTGTAPSVPTDGLVAYYPFNGNANDESGNGNNGTVYGATLTTDRFGTPNRAFAFNGTSDYIDCGTSSTLNVNQHTIALWVRASLAQNNGPCVSKVNPNTFESICLYLIYGRVTTSFAVGTEVNSGLQDRMIPFGSWHFIGMTYDGMAVRFYIDGAKDTTISRSGVVRTNTNPLQIGHHGGDNTFFEGSLGDIRIYNRALTDQEILALYQEGGYLPPLTKPSLSAWSADSTDITVQWNTISGATGYTLQSASDSTGPFSQLYSGTDTTYSHSGLTTNQKVWYRVQATNATQTSDWSDTAGAVASNIPTNGLVAYYPFNGNANDASGNGNNGTVNGATLTTDRFGNGNRAYAFNGTGSYIDAGATVFHMLPTAFSISVWFNTIGAIANTVMLDETQGATFTVQTLHDSISMSYMNNGVWITVCTALFNLQEWNHLAATYSNSIGVQIYLNGLLINTMPIGLPITADNDSRYKFMIGRWGSTLSQDQNNLRYFDGSIDDIRIYNRALTASEIQQLYHEGGWTGQ